MTRPNRPSPEQTGTAVLKSFPFRSSGGMDFQIQVRECRQSGLPSVVAAVSHGGTNGDRFAAYVGDDLVSVVAHDYDAHKFHDVPDAERGCERFAASPVRSVNGNGGAGAASVGAPPAGGHLPYTPVFAPHEATVEHGIRWGRRNARITDAGGGVIFDQDVEAPESWSDQAVNVVASKFFYGDQSLGGSPARGGREDSVRSMVRRVTDALWDWAARDGYFDEAGARAWSNDLAFLCFNQHAAFNSPVWFNMGLHHSYGLEGDAHNWRWSSEAGAPVPCHDTYEWPQLSACFIQRVKDDMQDIMRLATSEAMLFKYGSGTGTDLSPLRSSKEHIRGGGCPSGPVSFMRIYDAIASVVKSGGKCLAPHQPVFTASGVKSVKDLAESGADFTALSYSKRLGRVTARRARAWMSGRKEVWSLVTDKGEFHVSPDHPVMLKTGRFVDLDDLKPGMSLMASKTYSHPMGYVSVRLNDGHNGRELLHRLVASDVCGWDVGGRVIHHGVRGKLDSEPDNLAILPGQSEHAALHSDAMVTVGNHVFQNRVFPHNGESNGMHASSPFWKDDVRSAAYREAQGKALKESGRAADMQAAARRVKMLNTGYSLINKGYDIPTFDLYVAARKADGRRCPSVPGQLVKFEREFGSYGGFYAELRRGNHEVVSVRRLGVMDVYDVEVDDDSPDDGSAWDEHNFAIRPVGQDGVDGTCLYVHNTRRAAKMQTLKCTHPDLLEFITAKANEDAKARALVAAGYSDGMTGLDDEAYSSVMFQNCNMSVRLTNEFISMAARNDAAPPGVARERFPLRSVTTGETLLDVDPSEVLDVMTDCTWRCGDPGVQYEGNIQAWHTCATEPINSSNPCAEYMFIDDSACNLASLNLVKFRTPGGFDCGLFRAAVRAVFTAQEVFVDRASYPTEAISRNSHNYRTVGLGYANLGSLLTSFGLAYDSDEGRALAGAVTALMHAEAMRTSADIASARGPYPAWPENRARHLAVARKHGEALDRLSAGLREGSVAHAVAADARRVMDDALSLAERHGFRNAQMTLLAPTGTIAFMMDCDTFGLEPSIALVSQKKLAGGGVLKMHYRSLASGLAALGYDPGRAGRVTAWVDANGTVEGCQDVEPAHATVFDCAFPARPGGRAIGWRGHISMMAAVQPFLSGAISKTINMPADSTRADIRAAIYEGWYQGLKAVAVYRDGSKGVQPVTVGSQTYSLEDAITRAEASRKRVEDAIKGEGPARSPRRERLPATRTGVTHKFLIDGHEGYLTVGFYPDGRPGELFLRAAKDGSTVGGLMDTVGTVVSIALQYGIPLEVFARKLEYVKFDPAGPTPDPAVRFAHSLTDYVFRWLGTHFVPGYVPGDPANAPGGSATASTATGTGDDPPGAGGASGGTPGSPGVSPRAVTTDTKACPCCGGLAYRVGSCHTCFACGTGLGCS